MQRIEINEGELIHGAAMVLSWARDGRSVWYVLTEIEDTKKEAYTMARAERERILAELR